MSAVGDRRQVTPPLGGYVFTATLAILVLLSPLALVESIRSGEAWGLVSVLLTVPVLLWMGRDAIRTNAAVRDFRRWLRETHPWVYACGVAVRVGYVALVLLVLLVDVYWFETSWPMSLAGGVLLLLMGSMLSVGASALARWLIRLGGGDRESAAWGHGRPGDRQQV